MRALGNLRIFSQRLESFEARLEAFLAHFVAVARRHSFRLAALNLAPIPSLVAVRLGQSGCARAWEKTKTRDY
jgi:hypothetical protein